MSKPTSEKAPQTAPPAHSMPEGEQIATSLAPPEAAVKTTAAPASPQAAGTPGALRQQMDRLRFQCPVVNQAYLDVIHGATTAERQEILNSAEYRDLIRLNISGHSAMVVISALMEGSQSWRNPTSNDFYAFFVQNSGSGPLPNTATMNCWEAILYAAYLAGQTTVDYIRSFYGTAIRAADPNAEIWRQLGFTTSLPTYPATTPRAGQWIFYYPSGSSVPSHIALSLGGDEAMSLWNQPNNVSSQQRIRINDLATSGGTIHIGNPVLR